MTKRLICAERLRLWAGAAALLLLPMVASAQAGGTTRNGTAGPATSGTSLAVPPGTVVPGFLFEPEFPLASLKTVPIWNELEKLLDNPYQVALCSSLGSAPSLVQNMPGTTHITGSPTAVVYPAYCTNFADPVTGIRGRPAFGVTLPPLLVHPLNYNPTTGEEMRLLNPAFPGAPWQVPDELVQCPACPSGTQDPNQWEWSYRDVAVSAGSIRIEPGAAEIDYNAPLAPDVSTCVLTKELFPAPENSLTCGGDTGEPNYAGFGVLNPRGYSTPAVPGVASPGTAITSQRLYAPGRVAPEASNGTILPRDAQGRFGLRKPSLRVATAGGTPTSPNYLINRTDTGPVALDPSALTPSNENDYIRDRTAAAVLGKALFWDMQVGSDAVQACGSCHAHAGADNRTKNQMNPNHLGGDLAFEVQPPNGELVASDFPFHQLKNPDVAGDPKCTKPMTAHVNGLVLENMPNVATGATGSIATGVDMTVCDTANVINGKNNAFGAKVANDVASSMGVHFGQFLDIPPIGPTTSFGPPSAIGGVRSVLPDQRSNNPASNIDPIPGFAFLDPLNPLGAGHDLRRVEPRNTPTIFAAALNFDNFWDGRARHDFQGGSVFGASDPQSHVFVAACPPTAPNCGIAGALVPTRQIIRFVSLASLATGPALSEFEMSFLGRNWAKIGKKLLQNGVTPLANQLVAPTDSVLGPYSNQGGSACAGLSVTDRSGLGPLSLATGKPGLCISYPALIRRAFYPALWQNIGDHLNGCYTDGRTDPLRPDLVPNCPVGTFDDPFDHYVLTPALGAALPIDTNQFTQMEANFSLFFGLSLHAWATILMPDNSPYDQFLDANPDMFASIGEVGEPGLVGPMPTCTSATQRYCFREVGNFKRDNNLDCNNQPGPGTGEITTTPTIISVIPCRGTRNPNSNSPDPLLGMDIFQGSNFSLKNPNFRAARCGECHAGPTLTDNTMPFTFKAQLGDFIGEFLSAGNEALVEPLGRPRVISGFLLESEMNENGQDAIERRIANQSIVPCSTDGLAYPGGTEGTPGGLTGVAATCNGAAASFFDNGVYNLGVTRCAADETRLTGYCDDDGRGGKDPFGWPLSLATLLLKNLGGNDGAACDSPAACRTEPGVPLRTFDPSLGGGGGLFEETAQDQQINPGESGDVINPLLPAYLAAFANEINVGDAHPELDELHGGLNTLTDVAILEGFIDVLGPFNPAGVLNESMNMGEGPEMGTWPMPNRVGRFGSFKAPQLREVDLTGPYFHNGGKLTLRQVVDFYARGGDFPITNFTHRDFNIMNQNVEAQSNLSEAEKVALVDFLLELTDDRVRFERAPFDHPEMILPLDGRAPENAPVADPVTGVTLFAGGRDAMLAGCVDTVPANKFGPGQKACGGGMFLDVPAVGANGGGELPTFLNIAGRAPGLNGQPTKRLSGAAAFCATVDSHYCH